MSKLRFAYFGGSQDEIFAYENMGHATTWGWPDPASATMIDILSRAKARGVTSAIVSVDHLCYKPAGGSRRAYVGTAVAVPALTTLFTNLRTAGLLTMVEVAYPIDEPERDANVPEAQLRQCNADLRSVFATMGMTCRIMVIYGDGQNYRALDSYDWAGLDAYPEGIGVLTGKVPQLQAQLNASQSLILVPGGADDWRTPIGPFYDYALQHADKVALILPFIWTDSWGGTSHLGIHGNGMADSYNQVASTIRHAITMPPVPPPSTTVCAVCGRDKSAHVCPTSTFK